MIKTKQIQKPAVSAEDFKTSLQPPQEEKQLTEKNEPGGETANSNKDDVVTGVEYLVSVYRPVIVVDCHMHIMSGGCSPMPFLWKQLADKSVDVVEAMHLARETIEGAGMFVGTVADLVTINRDQVEVPGTGGAETEHRKHAFVQSVPTAKKNTYELGQSFTSARHSDVLGYIQKEEFYKEAFSRQDENLLIFLLCVAMPMDMEFAHIDGYYGLKVYNAVYKDNGQSKEIKHYWTPLHGRFFKKKRDEKTYFHRDNHPLNGAKMDELSESAYKNVKPIIKREGIPGVYYDDKGRDYRITVKATPCIVPDSETTRYEQWEKQLQYTELAMMADPLKLLPLFHYDPRRWQIADNPKGNTKPFINVGESGLYMGFKMYTAQGYRPWDMRLPIMKEFYKRCCVESVPVLNHCTPEGAYNFDREAYYEFRHENDPEVDAQKAASQGDAVKYFNDHFVSPNAWEEVLKQEVDGTPLNTLRICLAHFGGAVDMYDKKTKVRKPLSETWCGQIINLMKNDAYPNVYADISSSFANEKFRQYFKDVVYADPAFETTIRERILFGSDWYMTLLDKIEYLEYCRVAKQFLDEFDTSLWLYFTQANPYRFYRLDEDSQIGRIARNIIAKRQNEKDVREVLEPLLPDKIDEITAHAAYIMNANKPFEKYQERGGRK